jgi:hypothetical protein
MTPRADRYLTATRTPGVSRLAHQRPWCLTICALPLVPPFRDQGAAGWRIGRIEDLPQFAVDAARTQHGDTQTFGYFVLEFVTQLAARGRQVCVLATG